MMSCTKSLETRVRGVGVTQIDADNETGGYTMPSAVTDLLQQYVNNVKIIYGEHLRTVILYGSYARGNYREDSDIDIMILLDIDDMEIKGFRHELSYMTYDFNMDNDVDIKPIAKDERHFRMWVDAYPFYANVDRESLRLYEAA